MRTWFHGRDGLGDHGYQPAARTAEETFAVDAMVRIIEANPGIELITLGPLTNLALALRQSPDLAANVSRCVVMGGAPCCEGNVTPAAEYNFWVDPEAARVVLRSQLPDRTGWLAAFPRSGGGERPGDRRDSGPADQVRGIRDPLERHRRTGHIIPRPGKRESPCPIPRRWPSCSIRPFAGFLRAFMDVQVDSGITRGMSVVDRLGVAARCQETAPPGAMFWSRDASTKSFGRWIFPGGNRPCAGARLRPRSHLRHRPSPDDAVAFLAAMASPEDLTSWPSPP